MLTICDAPVFASSKEGADWQSVEGMSGGQHFSSLEQIYTQTVEGLGLAWPLELAEEQGLQAIPLAVDGILYFTGSTASVYAVDGASGKLPWKHDPESWKCRDSMAVSTRSVTQTKRS